MQKFGIKVFLVVYIILVIFQVLTTNIKEAYTYSPHQIDFQIQRMNRYPPSLARIGYIVEVKKEVQIFKKLEKNFFFAIDFKEYFPNRLPYVFSPFFFVGLYIFIRDREKGKIVFYGFLTSIIIFTLIGSHAKYGPILIMPYLVYFIILGILKVFRPKWL